MADDAEQQPTAQSTNDGATANEQLQSKGTTASTTVAGKSRKKVKGKTFDINELLNDLPSAPSNINWSDVVEREKETTIEVSVVQKQRALPTAPRAEQRERQVDLSMVPNQAPFIARISNVDFGATEQELQNCLVSDYGFKPIAVQLRKGTNRNNMPNYRSNTVNDGFGFVHFSTIEELATFLQKEDLIFKGRDVRTDAYVPSSGVRQQSNYGNQQNRPGYGGRQNTPYQYDHGPRGDQQQPYHQQPQPLYGYDTHGGGRGRNAPDAYDGYRNQDRRNYYNNRQDAQYQQHHDGGGGTYQQQSPPHQDVGGAHRPMRRGSPTAGDYYPAAQPQQPYDYNRQQRYASSATGGDYGANANVQYQQQKPPAYYPHHAHPPAAAVPRGYEQTRYPMPGDNHYDGRYGQQQQPPQDYSQPYGGYANNRSGIQPPHSQRVNQQQQPYGATRGGGHFDTRRSQPPPPYQEIQNYRGNDYGGPIQGPPMAGSRTEGQNAEHFEEHHKERPKLQLLPRSTSDADSIVTKSVETANTIAPKRSTSIFGEAKPVDTTALKEMEVERRLEIEREERRRKLLEERQQPRGNPLSVDTRRTSERTMSQSSSVGPMKSPGLPFAVDHVPLGPQRMGQMQQQQQYKILSRKTSSESADDQIVPQSASVQSLHGKHDQKPQEHQAIPEIDESQQTPQQLGDRPTVGGEQPKTNVDENGQGDAQQPSSRPPLSERGGRRGVVFVRGGGGRQSWGGRRGNRGGRGLPRGGPGYPPQRGYDDGAAGLQHQQQSDNASDRGGAPHRGRGGSKGQRRGGSRNAAGAEQPPRMQNKRTSADRSDARKPAAQSGGSSVQQSSSQYVPKVKEMPTYDEPPPPTFADVNPYSMLNDSNEECP